MAIGSNLRGATSARKVVPITEFGELVRTSARGVGLCGLCRSVERAEDAACFFCADPVEVTRSEEQPTLAHRAEHLGSDVAPCCIRPHQTLPELLADESS